MLNIPQIFESCNFVQLLDRPVSIKQGWYKWFDRKICKGYFLNNTFVIINKFVSLMFSNKKKNQLIGVYNCKDIHLDNGMVYLER